MENKFRFRSLSRRAEFEKLRAEGQSVHINSWLLVNIQKTEMPELRCGWTIPRQVGTAVVRNRLRRWGREFLRKWATSRRPGANMNLVMRRRDKDFYRSMSHKEFDGTMEKLVAKIERYIK